MTTDFKNQVKEKLVLFIAQKGSQNKAANSLNGVSSALLSQIMNDNWENISETMWRNVASQIGHSSKEWVCVETTDFKIISQFLNDAQQNANVFAMTGDAGSGKSKTFELYIQDNKNSYLLSCAEYWNRKEFLVQLLTEMGVDYSGFTVAEMMNEIVKKLKSQQDPLIILDEADKLPDTVLYFFITLYNRLEDHCGIVMCATDHLSKRINKGIKLNRKGYKEINSRIGRKFIELKGVNYTDVTQICIANGVEDSKSIKEIFNDAEGDLRRVKRKIHAVKNRV
ncbi:ATP-binding protein [Flavobacterium branchiarum]|uniref:AAA family ATPase n=1 Tax=Flavobacterium branchiarum TaxID=1114870 RepID=A0ABV5FQY6_9FLAO|nr:ATP-binding protein [Flavobacterium branchiarum]MDN3671661.1 ATP-binding protein [Flavobacterium branchiarum]